MPTDAFLRELVATGHWYGEIKHRTKEGKTVIVESRMVTMEDPSGMLVLETNRDVTERHAIHQEVCRLAEELDDRVRERTKELVQSQALLRQLASELTIAEQRERRKLAADLHDYLAQLLVAVRLKVSQSRSRLSQSDADHWLAEAEEVLQKALDYTRSLVAQLAPMTLQEFGLPAALKWLGNQMAHQYQLNVSVDCDPLTVPMPEDQAVLLYQSVRELLINVAKHARVDKAAVRMRLEDGRLQVTVTDEGIGSSAEIMNNGAAAKFGLFSIKERMTALGGWFAVDSAPGKGTMATLTLPLPGSAETKVLSPESGLQKTQHAALNSENRSHSALNTQHSALYQQHPNAIRVLLVDDHDMVRKGLRSVLGDHPRLVVVGEAADGEEAVALAASLKPTVVIMDVNMPKMDGVEAARRIKQSQPSIIVIGLSMHDSGQHEEKMRESGASAYLTKDSACSRLPETIFRCQADAANGAAHQTQPDPLPSALLD